MCIFFNGYSNFISIKNHKANRIILTIAPTTPCKLPVSRTWDRESTIRHWWTSFIHSANFHVFQTPALIKLLCMPLQLKKTFPRGLTFSFPLYDSRKKSSIFWKEQSLLCLVYHLLRWHAYLAWRFKGQKIECFGVFCGSLKHFWGFRVNTGKSINWCGAGGDPFSSFVDCWVNGWGRHTSCLYVRTCAFVYGRV